MVVLHPAILTDFSRLPERVLAAAGVFSDTGDLAALANSQLGSGHCHQGRRHRHRHSGVLIHNPKSENCGATLGSLNSLPDLFRHRIFCCYWTIGISKIKLAKSRIGYQTHKNYGIAWQCRGNQ
jgi:hypothetical protein